MNKLKKIEILTDAYKRIADRYKESKQRGEKIEECTYRVLANGAYYIKNGYSFEGSEEGSKPYYNYLKYGNQYQEEVKEEPIMIEDNYNNYETPYSFEYEPYMIEFNHEVDTNNSIQMIEELYNEDNNVEEDVDSNDIINIMDILSNKISKVKKSIIHYISNYRPIMNQYTDTIEAVLIE